MASGGHNIKSVVDHKAKGNYQPVRHDGRAETKAKLLKTIPKAPEYFTERERKLWEIVCQDIFDLGILSAPDVRMVEMYVSHWFLWRDAVDDITKNGVSVVVESDKGSSTIRNPYIQVMNESSKIVTQIADKFGFSPRARMGIKVSDPEGAVDPASKFFDN